MSVTLLSLKRTSILTKILLLPWSNKLSIIYSVSRQIGNLEFENLRLWSIDYRIEFTSESKLKSFIGGISLRRPVEVSIDSRKSPLLFQDLSVSAMQFANYNYANRRC